MPKKPLERPRFFVGIDGGGSGTRVIIVDQSGNILAQENGPDSALAHGIPRAWLQIKKTLHKAFQKVSPHILYKDCVVGIGISGANYHPWKREFIASAPPFAKLKVETDGVTALLGAHQGRPGIIIAIGTGTVGVGLFPGGKIKTVAGWGFPSGDEGSGSWLGLEAANLTQHALDGRQRPSPLTKSILRHCGGTQDKFFTWLIKAGQYEYGNLAPLVFQNKGRDPLARNLLKKAARDIEKMVLALDPKGQLPLAITGSVGKTLLPFLSVKIQKRVLQPKYSSTLGALFLVHKFVILEIPQRMKK